jgi:hypothetical protein
MASHRTSNRSLAAEDALVASIAETYRTDRATHDANAKSYTKKVRRTRFARRLVVDALHSMRYESNRSSEGPSHRPQTPSCISDLSWQCTFFVCSYDPLSAIQLSEYRAEYRYSAIGHRLVGIPPDACYAILVSFRARRQRGYDGLYVYLNENRRLSDYARVVGDDLVQVGRHHVLDVRDGELGSGGPRPLLIVVKLDAVAGEFQLFDDRAAVRQNAAKRVELVPVGAASDEGSAEKAPQLDQTLGTVGDGAKDGAHYARLVKFRVSARKTHT